MYGSGLFLVGRLLIAVSTSALVILMLAGCFARDLTQIPHCVDGLYHLVHFWSGWYWLFVSMFSTSLRSSCEAGLVVAKSLSNCLSIKDFIFPSLMKLSLAGREILD